MDTTEIEVLPPLQLVVSEDLAPSTGGQLREAFEGFFAQADQLRAKALQIQVVDVEDKDGMKLARETRLALRSVRVAAEKTRKGMKAESLLLGRAIDGAYNLIAHAVTPLETRLEEMEKLAETKKREADEALRSERAAILAEFDFPYSCDLAVVTEEAFADMVQAGRDLKEVREARERKEEEDRKAAEQARLKREAEEAAERQRIAAENAKLKAEAEAREKAMQAEREAIEAKAKAEAEAREKAEQEARQLKEAEAKRLQAEEDAKRAEAAAQAAQAKKAAGAPDKAKLIDFASEIRALVVPEMKTPDGSDARALIADKKEAFAQWIEKQAATL